MFDVFFEGIETANYSPVENIVFILLFIGGAIIGLRGSYRAFAKKSVLSFLYNCFIAWLCLALSLKMIATHFL